MEILSNFAIQLKEFFPQRINDIVKKLWLYNSIPAKKDAAILLCGNIFF